MASLLAVQHQNHHFEYVHLADSGLVLERQIFTVKDGAAETQEYTGRVFVFWPRAVDATQPAAAGDGDGVRACLRLVETIETGDNSTLMRDRRLFPYGARKE